MRAVPGQLEVAWDPAGVEVAFFPLRRHPEDRESFYVAAVGRAGVLALASTVPLLFLQGFHFVADWFPPLVVALTAVAGVIFEAGVRWRRENAHITLRIQPDGLDLIHRMGPLPVVTESVDLGDLERVQLDEDGTLRMVLKDGKTVCEPLPGLSSGARTWILDLIKDARRSSAGFWLDHVATDQARAAMDRLTERIER